MILIYLLKVSACTALFFAVYHFLLARLTFFNLNRVYLLLMLVFSFIIPALTIENIQEIVVPADQKLNQVTYAKNDGFVEQDFIDNGAKPVKNLNWELLLVYAYLSILILLSFRMVLMMIRIKHQLRKNKLGEEDSVILVGKNSAIKNCSFLNRIVVDISLPPSERELVIRHELVHVKQLHAADKLLANVVTAVLWFNPVIYFWRNAIDHNHEFLADRETSRVADKKVYASLLLNLAMPAKQLATHSFSKLPLKNRIMMLYKEPNAKLKRLAYLAVVPVLLICCMAFINRKEIIVEKTMAGAEIPSDAPRKPNVYAMNYLKDNLIIKRNTRGAIKAVEVVLVVDAGHGGKDAAATAVDGQREKDLNLRAVKILKEEAAKRGIKVLLTRDKDEYLSLRDRLPQQPVTAFISIHHNAGVKNSEQVPFNGVEVYVSKLNKNIKVAEEFGTGILSKLNKLEGLPVRGALKEANLYLLRESKAPAVVIEMGNIADEKSLEYISQEKNIRRMSNLILDGFVEFSQRGC
ncbi:M56/M15 family metallopeptidase [Pedobacter soli]|uniref:N-acetylmuramoyl-L-alanine amidase n=1 Tax=Pedobacter soli TaxID=390242 RepID=A0A1G6M658_9SPHI|nr:M56/M15 family metallopeptidase [Pedobacter soli]SDC50950.1 N-acetylmuramoyl-L-alanine amidase [Pedobacter soli]